MDRNRSALFLLAKLALLGSLGSGCLQSCQTLDLDSPPRTLISGPRKMELASNKAGTVFRVRELSLDAGPEEGWEEVGRGEVIQVSLEAAGRYEIEAQAPGYRTKVARFTEPIKRYNFVFYEVDLVQHPEESPPAEVPDEMPPFTQQRHALVVGISTYKDPSFRSLRNARKDAEALAEFLRSPEGGNLSPTLVHLLVDEDASRAAIIDELIDMTREANEGDLIILFFACHARAPGGEGSARYLIPFDGKMSNPEGTSLEKSEIVRYLDEALPRRQMLILDCCFAGGPVVRAGEIEENVWQGLSGHASGPARVVLTSTTGGETSLDESPGLGNSPFADTLLRALRGDLPADMNDDGTIDAQELFSAIGPQVRMMAREQGHEMTPQLYGEEFAREIRLVQKPRK